VSPSPAAAFLGTTPIGIERRNLASTAAVSVVATGGSGDSLTITAASVQPRSRNPIEHGMRLVERHHDAADSLDQRHSVLALGATEIDESIERDRAALARGRHVW
jgi:hypothetical protein